MKQYEFIKDTDDNGKDSISVSDKPKRRLDLIPRLLCLLVAAIVWLWMVNFNDTDATETKVLKIQIEGIDSLEDNGMMIYGLDKKEITVTVKGSNRDLKKYDESEYEVFVDVSKIDGVGKHTLPLKVNPPAGSSLTLADSEPWNVSFNTDFIAEKTVPLEVMISNIQDIGLIKYSYQHSLTDTESNNVEIRGPKTAIDLISTARFTVDGSFAVTADSKTFSDFSLTFLDKNLNHVNVDNVTIEYSTENIEVKVDAIAHKNIPVIVEVKGSGNQLVKKPAPDSVEVWGAPSKIIEILEYVIKLDKAELGKTATHTLTNDELPEGISVKENVVITISFEESAD